MSMMDMSGVLGFGSGLEGSDYNPIMDMMMGMGVAPHPQWAKAAGLTGDGGGSGDGGGDGGGGKEDRNPLLQALLQARGGPPPAAAAPPVAGARPGPAGGIHDLALPAGSPLAFNAPSFTRLPFGQAF